MSGYQGVSYTANESFTATGGRKPYAFSWNATSGNQSVFGLTGLSLNAGRISGNFTGNPGTYQVVARVTDNSTQQDTMPTAIRILKRPTLSIATPSNLGTVDTTVTNSLRLRAIPRSPAVGGNYTWSLVGPVVKTPSTANVTITVSPSGILSYRAPSRCSANFTVRVQDRIGSFATKNFTVSFRNPRDLYIQTRWLPTSYIGYPYSAGISTKNGKDPISWSVIAGSLGPEFELVPQDNGRQAIIRWKGALPPSTSISKTFTLRASDSSPIKQVDECEYVLNVIPVPPPPPPPPPPAPKPKLFDRIQSNLPVGKILAVDDWNGDGLNDVFLRSRNPETGEDQSALYTNRGRFSFLSDDAFPVEARSAVKLFVEDFDNDGLSDLLSLDAQLRASLHINSGEGGFETTELADLFVGDLATIDPENDLSCSDIDADGDIDLIAAVQNSSGGHVVALWNRADDEGVFPSLFSGKSYLVKSTAQDPKFSIVSVDSNPKPDLLVLLSAENSSSNAPAVLYLNSGNASADYANSNNATSCIAFSTATQTAIIGSPDGSFVSADIDSDGDMDLIAPASLNENSSTLDAPRFFLNQGNNTFTGGNAPILDPALQHRGLAAFDADLDGAIDLVWTEVSGMGAFYPRLWKNTWAANSAFTDITELADTGLASVPASEIEMASTGFSADLDGDRDPDFLFTAASAEGGLESDPASFAVFRNNSESRGARWINTQLIGVFSPSRGTGARVVLQRDADIVDGNGTLVTAKPKFAQIIGPDTGNRAKNNLIFGLAGKGSADRVSVEWTSGLSTSLANALSNPFYWPPHRPPVYRFLRLTETDALPPQRPILQGRVIPWGAAPAGSQTAVTANLTDSVAISAGGMHSLSLAANGTVKAWGGNSTGQTATPPKLVDIVQISAGGSHNLALRSNGRITAWGGNEFAQSTVPPSLRYAKYIAAGWDFSLAIDGIGRIKAWGNNSTGQCAPPPDLGPVNAVAGGGEHALALLADGTLAAWGSNSSGQLDVPTASGTKFIQIAAGANHSLALTENGSVVAWGFNGAGQSTVPAEALQNISHISASGNHSLALSSDGTIITWGEGYQSAHLKPVASSIVAISAGPTHAIALKALSSGYDPRDFVDVGGGRFPDNDSLPEDVPLYLFPGEQVNSFRIGKYEVTRGEWMEVARWASYNGYRYFTEGAGGQGQYTHPAYDLSWFDAIAWCNAKSEMNGLTPAYKLNGQTYKGSGASDPVQIQPIAGATGFRLPTEIQWEWAARGGNLTKNFLFSGSNKLDDVAIYEGNSVNASPRLELGGSRGAFPVGSKLPNELGIHDMSGNVWEHCFSVAKVTSEDEVTGNLTTSNVTVSRGGSWLNGEVSCGFDDQAINSQLPGYVINTIGFRLALLAEPEIVVPNNAVEIQPTGFPQTYEFVVRDPGTTNSPWGSYRWTIEGNPPPGIAHSGFLNGQTLVLSGTPTRPGWYDIVLLVETDGYLVRKPLTLKITPSGVDAGEMVLVEGGTLPETSELAGQKVSTFLIGKYEVTWGEWKTVRDWAVANGYNDLAGVGQGSAINHPVRNVSWYDVVKWCNAKSQMEGFSPVYTVNGTIFKTGQFTPTTDPIANGYRLPGEAEWEWASRGGVNSKGYTYSGGNSVDSVGWYWTNSIGSPVNIAQNRGTWPVGMKSPNELGIFDMTGNVWERCEDKISDTVRRFRGGGWRDSVVSSRDPANFYPSDTQYDDLGFRLSRNIGPKISITGTLPDATLNQAYAGYSFGVAGTSTAVDWSISEGILPPGMTFSANGTFSGLPLQSGLFNFVARAVSNGLADEIEVVMEVVSNSPDNVEVSTFAGSGGNGSFADGNGTSAGFKYPMAMAFDSGGNLYVADSGNHRIRKITPQGNVTTFAGSGNATFANGNTTSAGFSSPSGLAFDASGNLYVADSGNHRIRRITPQGNVTTFAGSGANGTFTNGNGTSASFNSPRGLAFDANGNLYVSDTGNHLIRKISPTGNVTTFAGSGIASYAEGNGTSAGFNLPLGLSADSSGNLYVADFHNHRIRKITPSGFVSTFAGANTLSAIAGTTGAFADGIGENARFYNPTSVVSTSNGTIYVTDHGFNKVRKITPDRLVTTFAGTGLKSYKDGFGPYAEFSGLFGVAFGPNGSVYVSEGGNHRIRKISPSTNPPPPSPSPTYTVTLTRGGTYAGYGVSTNILPNGTTLSFSPLKVFVGLPVTAYVVIPADTSITPWGLVGAITITSAYTNTPVMLKVDRNEKSYIFSSTSYQKKPAGFFGSNSPEGNYYILE